MRWCAVSVDLDEIPRYHQIHGLAPPGESSAHLVYELAVDRFLALAAELDIPLTFFVVGADTERRVAAEGLRRAVRLGHELGNHSRDHLYDLVRRPALEQRAQVRGALETILANVGVRPRGFRAPGYTVTDELLAIVSEDHLYDSSVFPCPPYYAAKAAAFAALRLSGRRSEAILDSASVLAAPREPYRIGRPYFQRGAGMVELPIQVTRGLRLPYIGTGLILAGRLGAHGLTKLVLGERFINLELHGIDLLGRMDGLGDLVGYQPDVRRDWQYKLTILRAEIERLKRAGYTFVRLADAAAQF